MKHLTKIKAILLAKEAKGIFSYIPIRFSNNPMTVFSIKDFNLEQRPALAVLNEVLKNAIEKRKTLINEVIALTAILRGK